MPAGQISQGSVSGLSVTGLDELNRALRRSSKEVRLGVRKELRRVAEPVRAEAEQLAVEKIRRIGLKWSKMRIGLTLSENIIYVAPRQRGVKRRGPDPRKRPNLADLLMTRAMEPALERHIGEIEGRFGAMLDTIADRFSL